MVLSDERFKHVERNVAAINVITHSKITFDEKEESIDMCQAIEEMRAEERLMGRDEGREEGQAETAKRMLNLGKYTIEEIAICSDLSIEQVKELQKEV